ncbi:MAG: alpha/beta hydrolase [Propionibacteriaceae bacterium]|nr:alpha/beta hydrolase [Propionibacteriaceae bacterium]
MPIGYFITILLVAAATASALWPRPTNGPQATPSFALGTLANEIPFALTWYLLFSTWVAWDAGDLETPASWVAAGLATLALTGLAWIAGQSARAPEILEDALDTILGADRPRTSRLHHRLRSAWALIAPLRLPDPRIRRTRNVSYGPSERWNRLDVYRRRGVISGPAFVYFHPGGFYSGSKNQQSKLLLETLASHGWVCVSADYHLRTDYPAILIDAKRVIAWLRTEGSAYGLDASTVVASGGSAGAHLAVNCALSAGQPELQPGFEEVDTSVAAVIGLYGYYGRAFGQHPSAPGDFTGSALPPLLVVHGEKDPMATAGHVQEFVEAMRARGESPIVYAELPAAGHNFDLFASLRHAAVTTAVLEFTAWLTRRQGG